MSFSKQLEAMGTAIIFINALPDGTVWSLTCTNADDAESPSVLNIYAQQGAWQTLRNLLKLGKPVDKSATADGDQFVCFRHGTLYISIIEEE